MKTNQKNKILILILATIAITGMIGCSSSSGGGAAGTAIGAGTPSVLYNGTGPSITPCSHDVANLPDLSTSLESYTTAGTTNANWVRVRFNAVPTNLASPTASIAFWAYNTDNSGNPLPMQSAPFFIEQNQGGGNFVQISSAMTSVTWTSLLGYAASVGITATTSTAVMSGLTFVVQLDGALNITEVLSSSLYISGGTSPDRYIQTLIPQFYANPNVYAQSHPQYLVTQHPLYNIMNSGQSEAQFAAAAQAFCF